MGKVCAFLGHRCLNEDIYEKLETQIEQLILTENADTFWVGGHGEFDELAAAAVRKLQQKYPHITLILILAYVPQLDRYGEELPFDAFDYPDEAEQAPKRLAIIHRNKYIAKNCDFVIAYIRQDSGGAYEAAQIAKRKNKIIFNLAGSDILI